MARSFEVPGADRVIAYSNGALWVGSGADRTVTAVDPETGAVVAMYPVGGNPQPGATAADRLWVPNHEDDTVSVVELSDGAGGSVGVGSHPSAVLPVAGDLWSADYGDGTVTVVPGDAALGLPPLVTEPPGWLGTRVLSEYRDRVRRGPADPDGAASTAGSPAADLLAPPRPRRVRGDHRAGAG